NLDTLYRNYYKTRLGYTQLHAQQDRMKEDHQAQLDEFSALKDRYDQLRAESLDDALSVEVRLNRRNDAEEALIDLQNMDKEIREAEQRANQQIQKQKAGMDKRILEQIRDAIKTEAQTKGYLTVLNVQSVGATALQGMRLVPYHDEDAEITEDVLGLLNKGHVEEEAEKETTEEARAE
ncbi:OmpH family outer membrane protein, partial [Verrucomicrobiota bacterium]